MRHGNKKKCLDELAKFGQFKCYELKISKGRESGGGGYSRSGGAIGGETVMRAWELCIGVFVAIGDNVQVGDVFRGLMWCVVSYGVD